MGFYPGVDDDDKEDDKISDEEILDSYEFDSYDDDPFKDVRPHLRRDAVSCPPGVQGPALNHISIPPIVQKKLGKEEVVMASTKMREDEGDKIQELKAAKFSKDVIVPETELKVQLRFILFILFFGSVKEPKESLCLCVCLSVRHKVL